MKVRKMCRMNKLVQKSVLTVEDVERVGHRIKGEMLKRFER